MNIYEFYWQPKNNTLEFLAQKSVEKEAEELPDVVLAENLTDAVNKAPKGEFFTLYNINLLKENVRVLK